MRTLREIDQPRFAGAEVIRVEPVFWSTDELATALEQTLTTEGYVVRASRSLDGPWSYCPFRPPISS